MRKSDDNHIPEETTSGPVNANYEGVTSVFEALQFISERGYTQLWKAKRYGRWYMLKCLKPELAINAAYQQLLVKEFNMLMSVDHPGVVQCYSMEEVDGVGMCVVMEYVEGENLGQWLEKTHKVADYERVVYGLLDAVEAIHNTGLVHRDIKPTNVMIKRLTGGVKIIDFGLADSDDYTLFKQPAGTVGYVSPEQSESDVPDVCNDIYSLGALMEKIPVVNRRYRSVIKECLREIDSRYGSVEQLRTAMHATAKRKKVVGWAIIALLAAAAVAIAAVMITKRVGVRSDGPVTAESQVVDSVVAPDSVPHVDAIAETSELQLSTSEQQPPISEETTSASVEKAMEEGEKLLRTKFLSKDLRHYLDTVAQGRNVMSDKNFWNLVNGKELLDEYYKKIEGDYTKAQMTVIKSYLEGIYGPMLTEVLTEASEKSKKIDQ